jgi:hypothetical protein
VNPSLAIRPSVTPHAVSILDPREALRKELGDESSGFANDIIKDAGTAVLGVSV